MTLSPIMLRMPKIIYGIALLFFVWSFALSYVEMSGAMSFLDTQDSMVRSMMLRALFQAALEATYIALNGVLVHLLIAIWHNGRIAPGGDA